MRNKQTNELFNIMQENPELPVVFLVSNEEIDIYDEYRYTYVPKYITRVERIWEWRDAYVTDKIEIKEQVAEYLMGFGEYKDVDAEEFDEAVEKYIEENLESFEAIVVYM